MKHIPKPGPIPGTKKEYLVCAICTTLYISRIGSLSPRKTCGNAICVNKWARCGLHRRQQQKEYYANLPPDMRQNVARRERLTARIRVNARHEKYPNYSRRCLTHNCERCSGWARKDWAKAWGFKNRIECQCPCHTGGESPILDCRVSKLPAEPDCEQYPLAGYPHVLGE